MATSIPAALKAADITRFAHRAAQLETVRPAVAYWLNYWIVDQIIAKGLHQENEEGKQYTVGLMDKLEQAKITNADNDAIMNDQSGQAYIEHFALETFTRADNAMKANKATRQTVDTFQAAATFLELGQIWSPLHANSAAKIKFAKFHALRIAKAIKAGHDPNDTNPQVQSGADAIEVDSQDKISLTLMPSSPTDVQNTLPKDMDGQETKLSETQSRGISPLETQDFGNNIQPAQSYQDSSRSFGQAFVTPIEDADEAYIPSPLGSSPTLTIGREDDQIESSVGNNHQSHDIDDVPSLGLPITPMEDMEPNSVEPQVESFNADDDSLMQAQKHARFAISALNFEDVSTAIKELRQALETLGAR